VTKRTPEKIAALYAMAKAGASATEIARAIGVTVQSVLNWARAEGISLVDARSERMRKMNADAREMRRLSILDGWAGRA